MGRKGLRNYISWAMHTLEEHYVTWFCVAFAFMIYLWQEIVYFIYIYIYIYIERERERERERKKKRESRPKILIPIADLSKVVGKTFGISGTNFRFRVLLLSACLFTKAREFSLPYYFTYTLREMILDSCLSVKY